MSDSINPNQKSRSSRMNNAHCSESPNSIPTTVNYYGNYNPHRSESPNSIPTTVNYYGNSGPFTITNLFNNTGPVNFGSGSRSSSRSHSPSFANIPLPNRNG